MKWKKAPEKLVAAFDAALPNDARVERRKMFGYPCAFTGGNMFAGLYQEDVILRLAEEGRRQIAREGGAPFEPMPGRAMREYVVVPRSMQRDAKALATWLREAFAYGASLPPKVRKARKEKPAGSRRGRG
jgi:TfoX/Sxy family transcriptional regulator of competence genes